VGGQRPRRHAPRGAPRGADRLSRSFASVTGSRRRPRRGRHRVRHQAAVHRMQAPPYDVDAYLKIWTDEWTGKRAGLLRSPATTTTSSRARRGPDPEGSDVSSGGSSPASRGRPQRRTVSPSSSSRRGPTAAEGPVSEIDPIASLVDVVDLVEGLLVFAGHFGAVPIRYATGLDVPRDPKDPTKPLLGPDGKPRSGSSRAPTTSGSNSGKDAKFGQLEPAGLASFVTWAEHAAGQGAREDRARVDVLLPRPEVAHVGRAAEDRRGADGAPRPADGRGGSLNQSWRRLGQWILAIESPSTRTRVRPGGRTRRRGSSRSRSTSSEAHLGRPRSRDGEHNQLAGGDPFALLDPTTRAHLKALPGGGSGNPDPAASA
jgi:hypothetical protein